MNPNWKWGDPGYINIRGTNGTGKSTIIRNFLPPNAELKHLPEFGCHYYDCGTHHIVGKYETDCGGLDAVKGTHDKKTDQGMKSFEAGQRAIMHLAKIKTTLAEGVLSSTTFKGSQVIYDDLKTANVPYFWFTIDIDPEVVFNSILKRRVSKGNIDPLDTDKVCAKYRPVMTSHNKAVDYGIWTHYGDRNDVLQMLNLLATDGLSDVDYRLIRKFDINKRNAELKRWTDMGQVAPTPEMIAQYAPAPKEEPKPTSNALGGFFV